MRCPHPALLLLASALLPAVARGAAPEVEPLSSAATEIRFRVSFEAPVWREQEFDGRAYRFPTWEGVPVDGDEGGPALPTTYVQVAVPPRGEITLRTEPLIRGTVGGVRFPPLPRRTAPPPRPGRGRPDPVLAYGEGPNYAEATALPVAEILSIGVARGVRLATVAVRPAVWRPETGEATWFREVTVTLEGGEPVRPLARSRPDGAGRAALSGTLVNPEAAEVWSAAADTLPPGGLPQSWFDDADGWVKVRVAGNGIYALGANELQSIGVPVGTLDPRTLRLLAGPLVPDLPWATVGWDSIFVLGYPPLQTGWRHVYERPGFASGFGNGSAGIGERAILVEGEEDGTFDSGDRVVFYALGPDNYRDRFGLPLDTEEDWFENPYRGETVYWLAWGGTGFPDPPLRMETAAAAPGAGPRVTSTRSRLHAERNTIYDPSMHLPPYRWEQWFWESMDTPGGNRFRIDLPHLVPGTTLDLTMRLWGAQLPLSPSDQITPEEGRHHVRVTVNGADGGLHVWGGVNVLTTFVPYDVELAGLPSAALTDVICSVPTVGTNPNRYDKVHLAWMDFRYERGLDLSGAAGELEIEAGAADRTLALANVPDGELLVLDVSDAARPRRLQGGVRSGTNLEVNWGDAAGGVLAVAPLASLSAPAGAEVDERPARWLRDPAEPLDYVIVAADDLALPAELLADWRRDHLYPYTGERQARVRVVRVSDVMDEFAWGMWDPVALRYFLEYAYRYYGQPGNDPLSYCLFLGDASNDPRNWGLSGSRDDLPSWEDNRDGIGGIIHGNVQYVSDDLLVRLDGRDAQGRPDLYADLFVGRITARNRLEARQLLQDKVIRSEQSPDYGPWRNKVILVADDVCQGGDTDPLAWQHILQAESLDDEVPVQFDVEKIYLYEYGTDCAIVTKPAAKQDLLESWSDGAFFVNYTGHGGDAVWADEHVLDLADTPLLVNEGRYPVVGSFSCSVGKFSQPAGEGLGESHLRAPRGGALVSVAATHLTTTGANAGLNEYFMQEIVQDDPAGLIPVGVALMRAKWRVPVSSPQKYACLGDPASLPNRPREPLELSAPPALNRGETVTVVARIPGGTGRNGSLDLSVRDANLLRTGTVRGYEFNYFLPGAPLFRGELAVEADTARAALTLPFTLRGGEDGRVRAYAWGTDWDAVGVASPLPVGGTTFEVADTTGPLITFSVETGTETRAGEAVAASLEDPAGINITRLFEFQSVLLKVLDADGLEVLRQDLTDGFAYERGSTSRGEVTFHVPDLVAGTYRFQLSATDNYNNRGRADLELKLGGGVGTGAVFTDFTAAYPNPFNPDAGPTQLVYHLNQDAEISVRIFSVSGRLVLQSSQEGRAGPNYFPWDGTDERLDPVANGVYLVRLATRGVGGEEDTRLERVVVLR